MRRNAAECSGMLRNEVALFCYIDIGVVTLFCSHIGSFAASFSREVRLCGVRLESTSGPVLCEYNISCSIYVDNLWSFRLDSFTITSRLSSSSPPPCPATRRSPLTAHLPPLTAHRSLFTAHHLPECSGMGWNEARRSGMQWNAAHCGVRWNESEFSGTRYIAVECCGIRWNTVEYGGMQWNAMESDGMTLNMLETSWNELERAGSS